MFAAKAWLVTRIGLDRRHRQLFQKREGAITLFAWFAKSTLLATAISAFSANAQSEEAAYRSDSKGRAEQGDTSAQYKLSRDYFLSTNDAEGGKWLRKAAEQGLAEAQEDLGQFEELDKGDASEAMKWYRKAAEHGDPQYELRYANACFYGIAHWLKMECQDGVEAVRWYEKAASRIENSTVSSNGFPDRSSLATKDAAQRMAECYSRGEGVDKDDAQAYLWYAKVAEWWRRIEKNGDPAVAEEADFELGYIYANGLGVPANTLEANRLFENYLACTNQWYWWRHNTKPEDDALLIGLKFYAGKNSQTKTILESVFGGGTNKRGRELVSSWKDLPQDFSAAREFLSKSAEKDYGPAFFPLGCMYAAGDGGDKDLTTADEYFSRAIKERLPKLTAMVIGKMLLGIEGFGLRTGTNEQLAIKWLLKASADGDPDADLLLARCYARGNGGDRDIAEGVRRYKSAAQPRPEYDPGVQTAQWELADLLMTNSEIAGRGEAVAWYDKAAEGDGPAALIIGTKFYAGPDREKLGFLRSLLPQGTHVPCDTRLALRYLRKAAEMTNWPACFLLGAIYANGDVVDQNLDEADRWLLQGLRGDTCSDITATNIAEWFDNGVSPFRQNSAEAFRWWLSSAEGGDAISQYYVALGFSRGRGVAKDILEAVRWHKRSAEQGCASAQEALSSFYFFGLGVPKNLVEAYKWANLAAAYGATNAILSRVSLEQQMTRGEIAEGQRLAVEFTPKAKIKHGGNDGSHMETASGLKATGSGFFITDDGYLLTDFHVVEGATRIDVKTVAGVLRATLEKVDPANDIALLKVLGQFHPLSIRSSRNVKLGDSVFTIGFPNIEVQGVQPKLTRGDVNSAAGIQDDPRYFQTSVTVQPGNSGGPLIDLSGDVIGVISMRLDDVKTLERTGSLPQNVNYALKSSFVSAFLESIPQISGKLKSPHTTTNRAFSEMVDDANSAAALVFVY